MKKLGSQLRAFANVRFLLVVITTVPVALLVTAAVLIKDGDRQQTGIASPRAILKISDGAVLEAVELAVGDEQFERRADILEATGPGEPQRAGDGHFDSVDLVIPDHPGNMDGGGFRPGPTGSGQALNPAGAAAGTQNSFMSVSPDVVNPNTNAVIAALLSNFTVGESIQFLINGTVVATSTADSYGRLGARISTPAGEGYVTFEGVGQVAGKRAGGVALVQASATAVPGLAIAPHAIRPDGFSTIHMVGSRYPASTLVTIARNGVALGTVMSDSAGGFFLTVPVPAGTDTTAIYTANTTTLGTLNGQTVEERADAGVPPQGDQNVSRAYFDRPVFSSTGATLGWVGEGFQPGETVAISGCATASTTADGNGAVSAFLTFGAGSGVVRCVLTGAASGRVARSAGQGDSNAINVPAAINAPATLASGGARFLFLFDRLTAGQSGVVFIDGESQGAATTNASGYGSVPLNAPTSAGIHVVAFAGSSGQAAVAPLYVLAAGQAPTSTATPTATATATTSTPTPTAIPTAIPTSTPASTPIPRRAPRVIPFR